MQQTKTNNGRLSQRRFHDGLINYISEHGALQSQNDGINEYSISKKQKNIIISGLKQLIKKVDKCSKKAILVDESSNTLITVYNIIA